MSKKQLKEKLIGKTKIYVGKHLVKCTIVRNSEGNLEIRHYYSHDFFPKGTCSEMLNDELIIYPNK